MSVVRLYDRMEFGKPVAEFEHREVDKLHADFTVQFEYSNADFWVQNLKLNLANRLSSSYELNSMMAVDFKKTLL